MFLDFSRVYGVFFQLSDNIIEKWLPFCKFFCAIKFVLSQGIFIPSFMSIAYSNKKLRRGKNV